MGFFKKDEVQEREMPIVSEIKTEIKENEVNVNNTFKRRNLSLFDGDTIQYVIDNFPSMSVEIQGGLNNLANILEDTIDYIEDSSSEIIKKNRDFKISKAYRDTSIAIYDVVQNITEYVQWMQQEYEKNIKTGEISNDTSSKKDESAIKEEKFEEKNEQLSSSANEEEIEVYKDFSLKEPKAFKLKDAVVNVDDWDDLLVKTAEVLTKQYRENKYSNIVTKEFNPIQKKSTQNSFRDTVIEMLNEYKINLDEFKIIIK